MNVLFLDYDGVVNTPMWDETGEKCTYNFPQDNKVNNFQCVQWVSEFCQKYGYSIVVSSSWRNRENYRECLLNGGLRDGIEILGKTPNLPGSPVLKYTYSRGDVMPGMEAKETMSQAVLAMAKKCPDKIVLNDGQFAKLLKLCELVDLINEEDEVNNLVIDAVGGKVSFEVAVLTLKNGEDDRFLSYIKNADFSHVNETQGYM